MSNLLNQYRYQPAIKDIRSDMKKVRGAIKYAYAEERVALENLYEILESWSIILGDGK